MAPDTIAVAGESQPDLKRQLAVTALLTEVAIAANQADTLAEGARVALDRVCAFLGWPVGHLYVLDATGYKLESSGVWHLDDAERFARFREVTAATTMPPGIGLPGAVRESGRTRWITDVLLDDNFPRARIAENLGVRSALGVPVLIGQQVAGVLEFFSEQVLAPDEATMAVLSTIGVQLGRVAERERAAAELARANEALRRHNMRVEAEIDLRTQELIAEKGQTDRLKAEFLDTVSHELRTPLVAIMGYAEFLHDRIGGELSDAQIGFVDGIEGGALRLRELVDELLDFARMAAGSLNLSRQETRLAELLADVSAPLDARLAAASLTLRVIGPDAAIAVNVDAPRMRQALRHLIDNAIKFTPMGGTITVTASADDTQARIEVSDEGEGIAPGHLASVFDKFFQVDNSTTRRHGGAGLGLAVARAIVEAHGGRIGVTSEPGRGSTFWLALPLA